MAENDLIQKLLTGGGAAAMSALNPATAALAAAPEVMKLITGLVQGGRAEKLRQTPRPDFEIPAAVREGVGMARNLALDPRLPGQSFLQDQMSTNMASSGRQIREASAGSGERLAALSALNTGANQSAQGIAAQAAQQQRADQQGLMGALQGLGDWQHEQWKYEKDAPYREAMAAAQREGEASNRNVYGGIKGIGGAAASALKTPESNQQELPTRIPEAFGAVSSQNVSLMPEGVNERAAGSTDRMTMPNYLNQYRTQGESVGIMPEGVDQRGIRTSLFGNSKVPGILTDEDKSRLDKLFSPALKMMGF